ncbi:MAG: hypothetical protein FWF92_10930 [Oscillospiraceae bacterium]|nr:hypothetical protein [Oscillospiraceae bacterium]
MIEIFSDNSNNSGNLFNTYKTVRFCALVDHNIILSVETHNDGSEHKICQDISACKKKNQCGYFLKKNAAT